MTDSPLRGLSAAGAAGAGACHPTHTPEQQGAPHIIVFCPEQRAPSGVVVKDLRPLRGRPFGPLLDPDASPRRAHKQADNDQKKDHNQQQRG
jgi:hypothetical protein